MSNATNPLSSFSKETLVDFTVIPAGVALLGQKIVTSLPPKALALGGALSATAITFGNYTASGESTSRKIIFLVGALGIGALAMPDITSRLSKWTGIVINEREAMFITGIAGLLKAVTWTLENFTKFPKLKTPENVADLYSLQIRPLHMHFTNNPETFKVLDLRMQTALNKRFIDSEYSEIAPTGFSEMGDNFTKEELESLASYIDLTLLSKEERQQVVVAFYENDIPFASTSFQRDDFLTIPLGLDEKTTQDLSAEKLKWTHAAICYVSAYPKDPKVLEILCQRFFDAHLPSMHQTFHLKTTPTLPSSFDIVSKDELYLVTWMYSYYASHSDQWKILPFETQYQYNSLFTKCLGERSGFTFYVTEDNLPRSSDMIQVLYKTYSSNKALWYILPTKLQNILNELFLKDVPGCAKPLPTLQQASDLEITQLHRLFSHYSHLGEKFENPQKKSLSNRCKKLHLPLPPQLAAFEAEQSSKNLVRTVLMGAAVITTLAAWSFYTLIMKGLEDMEETPSPFS